MQHWIFLSPELRKITLDALGEHLARAESAAEKLPAGDERCESFKQVGRIEIAIESVERGGEDE